MAFEKVDISLAPFIGWGNKVKQHVTGYVVDYDEQGGQDFDGDPCPRVEVELTATAASFVKGERTNYEAGTTVAITCGQPNLAYGIKQVARKYAPLQGKLVKIILADLVPTDKGNDRKEFEIYVDSANSRSGGKAASNGKSDDGFDDDDTSSSKAKPADDDDEPPF